MPALSIVMPAYNEGEHIEACVREWYDGVVSRVSDAEIIVVDDCSRDDTGARLAALAARLPDLLVLRTPVNGGHGPALRFGLDRARGEFAFHTDSDRRVSEVRVRHFPRVAGQSLRGLVKWVRVGRRYVGELVALRAAERTMRAQGTGAAALRGPRSPLR